MTVTIKNRLLIDTDTAADDAVALLVALASPQTTVEALTIVSGNVGAEQAARNALKTLEVAGRLEIPVHVGAAGPMTRVAEYATYVHGADGLGDQNYPQVGQSSPVSALQATLRCLREHPGQITWIALGPLTNVATAILADPATCALAKELVIMGGVSDGVGNVTPAAEFNIWVDPEAARVVLRSGLPMRIVGWDISRLGETVISADERERLRSCGHPRARYAYDVTRRLWEFATSHGVAGMDLPDPVTMVLALHPHLGVWKQLHVDVECQGELTRGALVIDHLSSTGAPANASVCFAAQGDKVKAILFECLGATGSELNGN